MSTTRLRPTLAALAAIATFALPALLAPAGAAASSYRRHDYGRTVRLDVAGGVVEVSIVPDRGSALPLLARGPHHYVFSGTTADLVGQSYSVQLRNRTGERIKVVVGVDGLNVYEREEVVGRSDEDVGSILSPWSDRTLRGWQIGDDRAQRFVFSPPEWSEGEGRTESSIGLLTVQVYREWQEIRLQRRHPERDEGGVPGAAAPAPEPARPRSQTAESAAGAEGGAARRGTRPPIGTTAGDDVHSGVRTVYFDAASINPEAWATVDYGNARRAERPWDPPGRDELTFGLALDGHINGSRIVAVEPGSVADRAGLEPYDVIVRIDTYSLPSPTTTMRILHSKAPGEYAFLRVRRGPHELAVRLRLG